eukprot:TRINITY_DN30821_c0_g1_i2.p2 TRINITY_DN30821_c0_g1~~TRINITY_DN30821_c0_g1_i2.p2  ORF type:complete len:144 (-),score=3.83 TRINITY_DN30821_c0_g1_i2:101-502(-)
MKNKQRINYRNVPAALKGLSVTQVFGKILPPVKVILSSRQQFTPQVESIENKSRNSKLLSKSLASTTLKSNLAVKSKTESYKRKPQRLDHASLASKLRAVKPQAQINSKSSQGFALTAHFCQCCQFPPREQQA